jgi:AbiU2
VNCACRATERAVDALGNENLTVELFLHGFPTDSDTYKQLKDLCQRMKKHRQKLLPARNKLGAHADRDVIRKGTPLGAASWKEWDEFWSALEEFVSILNKATTGEPFDIKAAGVTGDAESC